MGNWRSWSTLCRADLLVMVRQTKITLITNFSQITPVSTRTPLRLCWLPSLEEFFMAVSWRESMSSIWKGYCSELAEARLVNALSRTLISSGLRRIYSEETSGTLSMLASSLCSQRWKVNNLWESKLSASVTVTLLSPSRLTTLKT
jgi:hypothetical protein